MSDIWNEEEGPHRRLERDNSPNWSDISDQSPPPSPRALPSLPSPRTRPCRPSPGKKSHREDFPLHDGRRGGRHSPMRGGGAGRGGGRGQGRLGQQTRPLLDASEERTKALRRMETLCLVLHLLVMAAALMTVVPLAMVTVQWGHRQETCPLNVDVPPGLQYRWGNWDMTACNISAFLPLVVVALSLILAIFHFCVAYAWRAAGRPPVTTASRVFAWVTVLLVALEVLVALGAALTLTESFRRTCISFDLDLSWNEKVATCKESLDERDEAYSLTELDTYGKVVTGLVGSWACVVATISILLVNILRTRVCTCPLLCL